MAPLFIDVEYIFCDLSPRLAIIAKGVEEDVNPNNVLRLKHTFTSVGECKGGESQTFQVKIIVKFKGFDCPKFLGKKVKIKNLVEMKVVYTLEKFLKCRY
jgi:hypothetical protein